MARFQIEYDGERLFFRDNQSADYNFCKISAKENKTFTTWAKRYQKNMVHLEPAPLLLKLGRDIFAWLDKKSNGWVKTILHAAKPPMFIDFVAPTQAKPETAAGIQNFLNVPWELLADKTGFLAGNAKIKFCPVRRLGQAGDTIKPSPYRLSLLFMAAEPHGVPHLDYEAEEAAIFNAVRDIGLDMSVEESGALMPLANRVREVHPDVLHLSCHGNNKPNLRLYLESEEGDADPVTPEDLSAELGEHRPGLLFLSACLTAEVNPFLTSYTAELIERGFPAALGWGGSVADVEATRFATRLYHYLCAQNSVQYALAQARFDMLNPAEQGEHPAKQWHLARLYLGAHGGGVLSESNKARRKGAEKAGYKEFLGKTKVPVAGRFEFTGRRQQIQTILREFRKNEYAGVLIHAVGRQGKSSLAARIAHRRPDLKTVAVYEHYKEDDILASILHYAPSRQVREMITDYRKREQGGHDGFVDVIRELLNGPFREADEGQDGKEALKPILLIVDDFERVLQEPAQNEPKALHTVRPEYKNAVTALIDAFDAAETDSRLLITSRTDFSLRRNERELTQRLLKIALPQLNDNERQKQYENNLQSVPNADWLNDAAIRTRCIQAARGNPGLQKLLFDLCAASKERSTAVLDEIEAYLAEGKAPAQEDELIQFLQNLALDKLLSLLTGGEKEALRATTLFHVPVPQIICHDLAAKATDDADHCVQRLTALGLWEQFEDAMTPQRTALAANALAIPLLKALSEKEEKTLAEQNIEPLYQAWGGDAKKGKRDFTTDSELLRLALLSGTAPVAAATAFTTLQALRNMIPFPQSAAWALKIMNLLDAGRVQADLSLLRLVGDILSDAGKTKSAEGYLKRAVDEIEKSKMENKDPLECSHVYLVWARLLTQKGEIDDALRYFEKSLQLNKENVNNKAVIWGDIAGIKVSRGDVDDGLALYQQRLKVFEELGDRRSAAVTLGDIARIKVSRGDVDDALALHQQRLKVFEELGDIDNKAVTLWAMAQIDMQKGDGQAAYDKLAESYQINMQTGREEGIAMVGLDLGRLLAAAGHKKEGMQLLQRSLQSFEKLGWQQYAAQTRELIEKI